MKINVTFPLFLSALFCLGLGASGAPAEIAQGCQAGGVVRDIAIRAPATAGGQRDAAAPGVATYMMFSGYHLEPYSDAYIANGLSELARSSVSGIVYATVGATDEFLERRSAGMTQRDVNARIFRAANAYGTKLWLQLRLYDNIVSVNGAPPKNYTAEEILTDAAVRKAFDDGLDTAVRQYSDRFANACRVIVFEEAGIYHAPQGGGTFWSSDPTRAGRPTQHFDELFADRMTRIFAHVFGRIKAIDPSCAIGMHLGHSVFEDEPVLRSAIASLRQERAGPDFVLYDLYLKAQPDFATYESRLRARAALMKDLGIPMFHLAQLHTMNGFQHGLGRTPSKADIDAMVKLDEQIGVAGIGFYTKNATKTANFDENPFDPNEKAQEPVFVSSRDRWEYGLDKLMTVRGDRTSRDISIVVSKQAERLAPQRLWIKDPRSNTWTFVGEVAASPAAADYGVFRHFPRSMLATGRASVCVMPAGDMRAAPMKETISILAENPSQGFEADDAIATSRTGLIGEETIDGGH